MTPEQQAELEKWYENHKEAARRAEREKREAERRKAEERQAAQRREVERQKAERDRRVREDEERNAALKRQLEQKLREAESKRNAELTQAAEARRLEQQRLAQIAAQLKEAEKRYAELKRLVDQRQAVGLKTSAAPDDPKRGQEVAASWEQWRKEEQVRLNAVGDKLKQAQAREVKLTQSVGSGGAATGPAEKKANVTGFKREEVDSLQHLNAEVQKAQLEAAARSKTAEVLSSLGVKYKQAADRFEERHQKGLEYLRDNPEVQEAIRNIQIKSAGYAVGGPPGFKAADIGLNVYQFYATTDEFRKGNYYEGSLKAANQGFGLFLDHRLVPGTSDVLNLSGAATTAYLYGYFRGL